eukprot:TRINITY_DN57502_c0_g1_i1.p1 TRINITY_DN57502_c0_g1~~TRINITY_DN57502_c0_g1_i1.p1  ORF type:complete len:400 (-),score=71.90 TRINITY_DN57502_c0_g1_i1:188-1387(-)
MTLDKGVDEWKDAKEASTSAKEDCAEDDAMEIVNAVASNLVCKDSVPIRPGNSDVRLFNDHMFSELRLLARVPNDFVNDGWNLESLQGGGGKSGALFALVGDAYVVKELTSEDHSTLLEITRSYFAHVRSGETLLCPIYLHFRDIRTGRYFFAMRNTTGSGPFIALYDLKGCADDKTIERDGQRILAVRKRIWNVDMWISKRSWTEERHKYFQGKVAARRVDIAMAEEQRAKVLHCIRRDCAWLVCHRLMDYSLLVAIKEGPPQGNRAGGGSGPSMFRQPLILSQGPEEAEAVRTLHLGIIDFFGRWSMKKVVAMCVKAFESSKATVPPEMYADRFMRSFEDRLQSAIAPLTGDCDAEGKPEDRLHSRTKPDSKALRCPALRSRGESDGSVCPRKVNRS